MPPPALAQASIVRWIAAVESVAPSFIAPKEFAEKMCLLLGWLRAPTFLTHCGRSLALVVNPAWAGTEPAQAKRNTTSMERFANNVRGAGKFNMYCIPLITEFSDLHAPIAGPAHEGTDELKTRQHYSIQRSDPEQMLAL